MRLICPNCSAQYEIDVTLVPDEGRDVQCSNCGHTWFELPPALDASTDVQGDTDEAAPGTDDADPVDDEIDDDGPSHAALAIEAASEDSDEDDDIYESGNDTPEPVDQDDDWDIPPRAAPPSMQPGQRRPADAAALGILREEAQREMSRRATPSEQIETQTDMGLDEIRNRRTPSRALRARMAHLNEGESEGSSEDDPERAPSSQAEVVSNADYQAPRRDLLPDIDEINSTLKSTKKRKDAAAESIARHQSGFRAGFLLMALAAICLIVVYAQAPAIARALPGSESALISYVDGANSIRDWIDGMMGK